jgi:1-acyl-sn-glycerol-3-phosphate acyltransferase
MDASEPVWNARKAKAVQLPIGFFFSLTLALPFARRVHGLQKLNPRQCHLFACNHVSLLDTLLISGLIVCRPAHHPMLVLGDKKAWGDAWVRRALARPFGFLLERGKWTPGRVRELQQFARQSDKYNLLVFPEGTRGNGVDVAECQPGIYYVAQTARVPLVPVFLENMQLVSTKTGHFHPIGGLRKVEVHFGDAIAPEDYLPLARNEFTEFVRRKIMAARQTRPAEHLNFLSPHG